MQQGSQSKITILSRRDLQYQYETVRVDSYLPSIHPVLGELTRMTLQTEISLTGNPGLTRVKYRSRISKVRIPQVDSVLLPFETSGSIHPRDPCSLLRVGFNLYQTYRTVFVLVPEIVLNEDLYLSPLPNPESQTKGDLERMGLKRRTELLLLLVNNPQTIRSLNRLMTI